jgi:hypothetical protein
MVGEKMRRLKFANGFTPPAHKIDVIGIAVPEV